MADNFLTVHLNLVERFKFVNSILIKARLFKSETPLDVFR